MKFLYALMAASLIAFTITTFYGIKFANPYKLIFVFGKKGSGKSTTMVSLAYKYSRKGYKIYCTDDSVPGTYTFDPLNFGRYQFDERSLILIDEVSLIWSNRDFKSFSRDIERQFRYQRKDRLIIYLFSQTFDVDKKIRDLADSMYLAEKKMNCITWLRRIEKRPTLTAASAEGESRITEDLRFDSILFWPFGSRKMIWIPKWARYFDSFSTFGWQRDPMPATPTSPMPHLSGIRLPSFPCLARSVVGRLLRSKDDGSAADPVQTEQL